MPKFLTFDNHHLAPVEGIDPKSLKRAAKLARTVYLDDERKLPHNLALNHIAHRLGFKGGYGGYAAEWKTKLLPFMRDHGLAFRKDVLPKNLPDQCVGLTHRQVADRLFVSGLPMPKRIFAGLDVFDLLRAAEVAEGLIVVGGVLNVLGAVKVPREGLRPAEISERVPPANYVVWSEEGAFSPENTKLIHSNLIGDQLCDMGEGVACRVVSKLYRATDEEMEQADLAGRLFRRVLDLCPHPERSDWRRDCQRACRKSSEDLRRRIPCRAPVGDCHPQKPRSRVEGDTRQGRPCYADRDALKPGIFGR